MFGILRYFQCGLVWFGLVLQERRLFGYRSVSILGSDGAFVSLVLSCVPTLSQRENVCLVSCLGSLVLIGLYGITHSSLAWVICLVTHHTMMLLK